MKKLTEILRKVYEHKIFIEDAEKQVLRLVVAFANAMGYNYEYLGDNKWQQKDDGENMIIDVRQYTTEELYKIFEKKKAKAN